MIVPTLNLVKTFHVDEYNSSKDMLESLRELIRKKFFGEERFIGIVYYYNGVTQTMGDVNFAYGLCDHCIIEYDELKSIDLYKVVL